MSESSQPRVTGFQVLNHYSLPDQDIDLHGRKHLILTGPNGSGKSTLLEGLAADIWAQLGFGGTTIGDTRQTLKAMLRAASRHRETGGAENEREARSYEVLTLKLQSQIDSFRTEARWSSLLDGGLFGERNFLLTLMPADRGQPLPAPSGPSSQSLDGVAGFRSSVFADGFLQHLVNRFTTMHLSDSGGKEARTIQSELDALRDALRAILVMDDLELVFDKSEFRVTLEAAGREMPWEHLAAGHQAVLRIVANLYTRLHAVEGRALRNCGVVLLDEPELHLHPEMQERILPGLIGLFPNLQFIVATHAPPCISSIPDAWVYDLRVGEGIGSEQLRGRPYGSLMTSHFRVPTDYDAATTQAVEEVLKRVAAKGHNEDKRRALRDELSSYLHTSDPRVLEAWNRLTLAMELA